VDAAGTTSYGYDTAGRLIDVTNSTAGVKAAVSYNSMSLVDKIVYGTSGNTRNFSYDSLHRVVGDELKTPSGTSIGKVAYGWDANGNEISKTTTGFAGSAANSYTYDLADRLTSWGNGSTTTNYAYDRSGNRTQNGAKTFTYDERNRLVSGDGLSYTYTPRGTLRYTRTGTVDLETQTDAFGQVTKQYATETGWHDYSYDGLGRVMRPGFAYTGLGNDLAADGTATYTRDPGGALLGVAAAGTQTLAWTDLHTDVVGEFTATGTTLSGSVAYDPLGRVLNTAGMIGNLGYQSEWTDGLTGRVNMHARWYNPATGQFDTRDSAENDPVPDSINANRYQYGDGNPMTVTDPTGHWGWNPFKAVSKAVSSAWHATTSYVSSSYSYASSRYNEFRSYARTTYHAAKKVVKKTYHAAKHYVKKKYTAAKRYVKKKYNAAKHYVKKKYNQGRKWVAKKYHQAKKAIKKAYHKVKQAGKHIVNKAKRAVKTVTHVVKDAYKKSAKWVKEHKAEIVGAVVGTVVGLGCGVAIGWTGVGAVACGALAGAVGSMVTGAMKGHTGWELAGDALIGGTIGAITGGLGSVVGQGIKAGVGAISGGLKSAGQAAASGMRNEVSNIVGGLTRAGANAGRGVVDAGRNLAGSYRNQLAGSIRGVNPTGGNLNCVRCAIATDKRLAGTDVDAVAPSGGPFPASEITKYSGRPFHQRTIDEITRSLDRFGDGARGIIVGLRGPGEVGHAFNVVNQKGAIRFLDGQSGGAANLEDGFKSFIISFTSKGRK
jgi:RHS repeat-associated protein